MSDRTNHLFFHIFIPVLSCKSPAAQQPSIKPANQSQCSTESPAPFHACLFSSDTSSCDCFAKILLSMLLLVSRAETHLFFKASHLICCNLFVVLMSEPCKHVNFNSDNKAWWFCLCCGSSFDGGCLGKRRDHLWSRVFRGNAAFKGTLAQRSHTQRRAQLTDATVTLYVFISIWLLWEAVVKNMMQKHK